MADYMQLTPSLKRLEGELTAMQNEQVGSEYSNKFVLVLKKLTTLLYNASTKKNPGSYIKSMAPWDDLALKTDLLTSGGSYFDIGISDGTFAIKDDFTIADKKMYSAILKFKDFVDSVPKGYFATLGKKRKAIIATVRNDLDKHIGLYELKALFGQIKKENEKFDAYCDNINRMFDDGAAIHQIETAVVQFVRELKDYQEIAGNQHANILSTCASYFSEEEAITYAKAAIYDYDTQDFIKRIGALNQGSSAHSSLSRQLSDTGLEFSFEETKMSDESNGHPYTQITDPMAPNTNVIENRSHTLELLLEKSHKIKADILESEENIRRADECIKMCQEEIDSLTIPDIKRFDQYTKNISAVTAQLNDLTVQLNGLGDNTINLNKVIEDNIDTRFDFSELSREFLVLKNQHTSLTTESKEIQALNKYVTDFNSSVDNKNYYILIDKEKLNKIKKYISFDLSKECDSLLSSSIPGVTGLLSNPANKSNVKTILERISEQLNTKQVQHGQLIRACETQKTTCNNQFKKNYTDYLKRTKQQLNNDIKGDELKLEGFQQEFITYQGVKEKLEENLENLQIEKNDFNATLKENSTSLKKNEKIIDEVQREVSAEKIQKRYKNNLEKKNLKEQSRFNELTDFQHRLKKINDDRRGRWEQLAYLAAFNDAYRFYVKNSIFFQNKPNDSERIKTKIVEIERLKKELKEIFKQELAHKINQISVLDNAREFNDNVDSNKVKHETIEENTNQNPSLNRIKNPYWGPLHSLMDSKDIFFKKRKQDPVEKYLIEKIVGLNFFGEQGIFTRHANAIKGCPSALLGMLYTCLAYASGRHFEYQTEIMFLEDLMALENKKMTLEKVDSDKTNKSIQETINNRIEKRLKDYPNGNLSEKLDLYKKQMELAQEHMDTPRSDDKPSLNGGGS